MWYHTVRSVNEKKVTCEVYCLHETCLIVGLLTFDYPLYYRFVVVKKKKNNIALEPECVVFDGM